MNERQFSKLDYKEWHIGVVSSSPPHSSLPFVPWVLKSLEVDIEHVSIALSVIKDIEPSAKSVMVIFKVLA